jgi:hypothetical protein
MTKKMQPVSNESDILMRIGKAETGELDFQ